ncbi:MAG: AI-2E family transporter [Verrucomicrobiota bacterium]
MPEDEESNPKSTSGAHILAIAASVIIVVAGLKLASSILVPFFLAAFLAILSFPLLFFLRKKGFPSWLAVLLSVLANLAIVSVIVLLTIQSVSNFTEQEPEYRERFNSLKDESVAWLEEKEIPVSEYFSVETIDPGAALGLAQETFGQIVNVFSKGFLVLLIMVFFLFEAPSIPDKMRFIMGQKPEFEPDPGRFHKITNEVVQYLVIKTVVSLMTGLCIGVGVALVGLDFPVLWGLVAFALNYIPTIGSVLASIPALLLAMVQPGMDFTNVVIIAAIYVSTNVLFGNFIEPTLMGRKLGLSTLVVTLSLVFWGWVWGPVGMLLSVPLTMVVKILLENTPDLRWVAVLLAQWPMDPKTKAAIVEAMRRDGADHALEPPT